MIHLTKINLSFVFILCSFVIFSQKQLFRFSQGNYLGHSFQFIFPQNLNDKSHQELMTKLLSDKMMRFQVEYCPFVKRNIAISGGINFGSSNYLQPIFQSHNGFGEYNKTNESVKFNRNHLSFHFGSTYFKSIYDDFFRLKFSGHIAYNFFLNGNEIIQRDFKNYFWNINEITANRYEIDFKDRNYNLCIDLGITMQLGISEQLYFDVGFSYFGARKFDYDYHYQFKFYDSQSEIWSEIYQHDNFLIMNQPKRIDNVFYFSLGLCYSPIWSSKTGN